MKSFEIDHKFFQDDELAECTPYARLLYLGLRVISKYNPDTKQWEIPYRLKRIRGLIFPFEECPLDMGQLLTELEAHNCVNIYYDEDGNPDAIAWIG